MVKKKKQLTIRVDSDVYELVKFKCDKKFGIGVTPLIQLFLRSFITQKGIGFYVGDDDLCNLFNQWLGKKMIENGRSKKCSPVPGPRLKDLYELNDAPNEHKRICQMRIGML